MTVAMVGSFSSAPSRPSEPSATTTGMVRTATIRPTTAPASFDLREERMRADTSVATREHSTQVTTAIGAAARATATVGPPTLRHAITGANARTVVSRAGTLISPASSRPGTRRRADCPDVANRPMSRESSMPGTSTGTTVQPRTSNAPPTTTMSPAVSGAWLEIHTMAATMDGSTLSAHSPPITMRTSRHTSRRSVCPRTVSFSRTRVATMTAPAPLSSRPAGRQSAPRGPDLPLRRPASPSQGSGRHRLRRRSRTPARPGPSRGWT
jgi:hypothetical protein